MGGPQVPVIAIDGPGGAGKGTVCRAVARALGWHLMDSGALYRALGLDVRRLGLPLADEPGIAALARSLDLEFRPGASGELVLLRGEDVTEAIRSESAGQAASAVAALPAVRQALVERQRACRRPPGLVADGRDMGSVIFPDATLKVFLTASAEERARRRHKQLKEKGIDVSLAALSREMQARDRQDAERPVAPLRPSEEARLLDTTGMEIAEVVSAVLHWVAEATGQAPEGQVSR
jgi:CMP/dCMP kinase